jgi:hypothetical protein
MPAPVIDFELRIKRIPIHVVDLPEEADVPRLHYERSANDSWAMLAYFERNLKRVNVYQAVSDRHLRRLYNMILLSLVEAFERFLKEIAAACIDQVGRLVLDDRLDVFHLKGDVLAAHFEAATIGKSLCESSTWLDCDQISKRFRKILADPFSEGTLNLFPKQSTRTRLIQIVWQLRHSIVHNAAVITKSDALKFQLLTRSPAIGSRVLWPTHGDVWYVKLFLDKTVDELSAEIANRLSTLLTQLHNDDPNLFDPAQKAQIVADLFQRSIQIGQEIRHPT